MNSFTLKNNILHAENVALNNIANEFGTPCYVYSTAALIDAFEQFSAGFKDTNHLVCFAVKSNPNLAILNLFASLISVGITSFLTSKNLWKCIRL